MMDVASLCVRKRRKRSEPAIALMVGIFVLVALYIAIFSVGSLSFFIYGTIGLGLAFEYGWIGVILRAAVAGDHDYEGAQKD
jgi:hypothetical protein